MTQSSTGPVSQTKVPSGEAPSGRSPLTRFKDSARGLFSKHAAHEPTPTEKELPVAHQVTGTAEQEAAVSHEHLPSTSRDVDVGREREVEVGRDTDLPSTFHKADTRASPTGERVVDTGVHDMAAPEHVAHEQTETTEVPVTRYHGFLHQIGLE